MISELRDRPIFICGHPKSGTSLLRGILDSHPQLVTYPEETVFFRRYLPAAQGKSLEQKLALSDQHLTHIFEWNRTNPPPQQVGFLDRDYSHVSAAAVRGAQRRLVAERYENDGDMLSAAILGYGEVVGRLTEQSRYWVEKTPYNEFYASQIFAWWPEARCIHMVRDPRDHYLSYHRKHQDWPPDVFASSWRRSTQAAISNQLRYGTGQYLLMRYEDFTNDPEGSIGHLCSFLGIDDDPALRNPTRAGKSWGGNSMFADQFQGISRAPVGRWHNVLSHRDCFVIEALSSNLMDAMHYKRTQKGHRGIGLSLRLETYKTLMIVKLKEKFE
jgi:sulfotransferase family protein